MMRIKRLLPNGLCLAILLFVWPMMSLAGVINLPQTGQTTCYDESDIIISCTGTGQDGDVQAGVPWPEPRFVDNGDGTITDHLTGLIWLKDANCFGKRNWYDALTLSNILASGTCGLTDGSLAGDWRLPNVVELESLVNIGVSDSVSWLISQGFTSVQPSPSSYDDFHSFYWSASVYHTHYSAKTVGLRHGRVNEHPIPPPFGGGPLNVWPVRGGKVITDANVDVQPAKTWHTGQTDSRAAGDDADLQKGMAWPLPRFSDNGNGTITDHLTGLIWLKNANCFYLEPRAWADALSHSNSLASGSCGLTDGSLAGDWRLPNRKELFSLIDHSQLRPALPPGHPFVNVQWGVAVGHYYWSASTLVSSGSAYQVSMRHGRVATGFKTYEKKNYVWPVRDGDGGIGDNGGNGGDGTGDGGGDANGDDGADGSGDNTGDGGGVDTGDGGGVDTGDGGGSGGGGGGCFIGAVFSIW